MDQDLVLRIGGDSSQGQQAVFQLADAMANSLAKALSQVKQSSDESGQSTSALKKYLDELTPSTEHAHAAFSDLKGTLSELWEHPTQHLGEFAKALSSDLGPALGSVGVAAGVAAGAIAVIGTVLLENSEKALEFAANVQNLARLSNESAAPISNLAYAWQAAGGSLDSLNTLMFMFEQRMEVSPEKVAAGLKQIGLSFETDLADLNTTDRILKISEALQHVPEGTNVAGAAFEIFGRGARSNMAQLTAPLSDLTAGFKDMGATITDKTAAAARDFQIELGKTEQQTKATWTAIGLATGSLAELWEAAWARMKLAVANVAYDIERVVTVGGYLPALLQQIGARAEEALPTVASSVKGLADGSGLAAKGLADYLAHVNEGLPTLMSASDAFDKLNGGVNADIAANAKRAEEQKKTLAEVHKLEGEYAEDSMNWVSKLSNTRVEAIAGWKEGTAKAFADVDKLEGEYATDAMNWVSKLSTTRNDSDIKWAAHEARVIDDTQRLWIDYYDLVGQRSSDATTYEISLVQRWYDEKVQKAIAARITDQQYYTALAALADEKMRAVYQAHDQFFQDTKRLLGDLQNGPGGFVDTFSQTLAHTGNFGKAFTGVFQQIQNDLENIFGDILSSIIKGFLSPLLNSVASAASKISSSLANALSSGGGWGGGFSLGGGGGGGGYVNGGTGAFDEEGNWVPSGGGGGNTGIFGGGLAGSLATAGIGAAIGVGVGALVDWIKGIGGPSQEELQGRSSEAAFASQMWSHLTAGQRQEAGKAVLSGGWSDPKEAGVSIGLRDILVAKGESGPQAIADSDRMHQQIYDAIKRGPNMVEAVIASFGLDSFADEGIVRRPTLAMIGDQPGVRHGPTIGELQAFARSGAGGEAVVGSRTLNQLIGGGGGGGVIVNVTVEGNVLTERDLVESVSEGLADLFTRLGGRLPLAAGV